MFEGAAGGVPPKRGYRIPVRPPRPVWVDLARVYPHPRHWPRRVLPEGLDLQAEVPGDLLGWNRSTTGLWVGLVRFAIQSQHGSSGGCQWVPAHALSPRRDTRDRR